MRGNPKKNIIVLLLDTVRSDVVFKPGLKTINELATKGTYYANTVAPGTWTAPSHASLFTDKKVSSIQGVSKDFFTDGTKKIDPWMVRTKFLEQNTSTLAGKLSALGYQTSLFSNNPFLTSFTNLGTGFDTIYDIWLNSNVKYNKWLTEAVSGIINGGGSARERMYMASYWATRLLPKFVLDKAYLSLRQRLNNSVSKADGTHMLDRGAEDTNKEFKNHLEYKYNYKPQFTFMNFIEAHENYPVSKRKDIVQDKWLYLSGIRELDNGTKRELYSGYMKRIQYLDSSIAKTLQIAKGHGILDNATVVITSDHGQLFGEHGLLYHSLTPYEEVVKVPLIVANYTDGEIVTARDRVENVVTLNALHNSIFNLASQKYDYLDGDLRKDSYVVSEHMGISEGWDEGLLKRMKKRSKSAGKIYDAKQRCNMKAVAIYKGNMKLIHYFDKKQDELYNILVDPKEQDNRIASDRGTALRLARQISG